MKKGYTEYSTGRPQEFFGPPNIWHKDRGFLLQSTDPASYHLNFPTTGANNLFFDLVIEGDATDLIWTPVTHAGITATVTPLTGCDYNQGQYDTSRNRYYNHEGCFVVYRVKLTGPSAIAQGNNDIPAPIAKPNLPQTFELVGKDSGGNEIIKYGFQLRQWFVSRAKWSVYSEQLAWCNGLGYRMPQIKDLTNAGNFFYRDEALGNVGGTPSSNSSNYTRVIGGGFLGEWGDFGKYYPGVDPISGYVWTSNTRPYDGGSRSRISRFAILSWLGEVDHQPCDSSDPSDFFCHNYYHYGVVCVTP
ncbi:MULTISPECIES: hypothetical protein [unclassified Gilliamella]|uniref:hypothetical protein n=1 Tax=unclassified Gilliamella TaxID=2685620 RepID=UPI00130C0149|nr:MULTISPECIES: hypothetical protein [unclassified Gilliamella]MWP48928.1 hypothetical protein [Gilliamella sp. Lep-s35]MWP68728.1 hypothetical protein [Gilliamella sp. Lep-s5]MWP77199.1 hypothetical protein [Gilliamella sp. Lep-s21]